LKKQYLNIKKFKDKNMAGYVMQNFGNPYKNAPMPSNPKGYLDFINLNNYLKISNYSSQPLKISIYSSASLDSLLKSYNLKRN